VKNIFILIVGVAIIAVGGYFYPFIYKGDMQASFFSKILNKSFEKRGGDVRFTDAASLAAIPLPEVRDFDTTVKFVEVAKGDSEEVRLDYQTVVSVAALEATKASGNSRSLSGHEPAESVVYLVNFQFSLLDRDGFELTKLISEEHRLFSGKTNKFNATIKEPIPLSLAERVEGVEPLMLVVRCDTCD
jgi:hypothetical protein